jgi:hypothetical protein
MQPNMNAHPVAHFGNPAAARWISIDWHQMEIATVEIARVDRKYRHLAEVRDSGAFLLRQYKSPSLRKETLC